MKPLPQQELHAHHRRLAMSPRSCTRTPRRSARRRHQVAQRRVQQHAAEAVAAARRRECGCTRAARRCRRGSRTEVLRLRESSARVAYFMKPRISSSSSAMRPHSPHSRALIVAALAEAPCRTPRRRPAREALRGSPRRRNPRSARQLSRWLGPSGLKSARHRSSRIIRGPGAASSAGQVSARDRSGGTGRGVASSPSRLRVPRP